MPTTPPRYVNRLGFMGRVIATSSDGATLFVQHGPNQKKDVRQIPNDHIWEAEVHEVALIDWWIGTIDAEERDRRMEECKCKCCANTDHLTKVE